MIKCNRKKIERFVRKESKDIVDLGKIRMMVKYRNARYIGDDIREITKEILKSKGCK